MEETNVRGVKCGSLPPTWPLRRALGSHEMLPLPWPPSAGAPDGAPSQPQDTLLPCENFVLKGKKWFVRNE